MSEHGPRTNLHRLLDGVDRFRSEEFGRYEELFRRLSREGQNPHTLFITCSDSRVLAELITQSRPGDLFVVKNVGNIVPHARDQDSSSTSAAIEFAVEVLGVSDIVVCGHSQCGAMDALVNDTPAVRPLMHLQRWLELVAPVREIIQTRYAHVRDRAERAIAAAEENVLFGLENLHSHACVQHRLAEGRVRLHAWFFKIATAELFAYDPRSGQFDQRIGARTIDASTPS